MHRYIVRPNDTLYLIAKRFGVTIPQILMANPEIKNPALIYIGQVINIPSKYLPVPKQLEIIESNAEDIIEDIERGDWRRVEVRLARILRNIGELNVMHMTSPAMKTLGNNVIELRKAVKDRKAYDAKVAANAITKSVADLLDGYMVQHPSDILRLDYLAREIMLNVENNDWASADNNFKQFNGIWDRMKSGLGVVHSYDVAKFEGLVDALGNAITNKDSAEVMKSARDVLEGVDMLEDMFKK